MKKIFLLTLLCPLLLGVALTNNTASVVNNDLVETLNDVEVYTAAELGVESKVVGPRGAVVGDATLDHSETYYQLGTNPENGHSFIRFATAVKGDLESLSYDLTYNGQTEVVNIEKVYKGISDNGTTKYYGPNGLTTNVDEATHYFACFTLEFRSDAMANTNFEAKLNVVAKDGTTSSAEAKSTTLGALKYDYKYVNGVALDGKMDDAIYTEAVKTNKYSFVNSNNDRTSMDIYATRDDKGVYFYVSYITRDNATTMPDHVDWWKGENVEFRLVNQYSTLTNTHEMNENPPNVAQYWASAYYGGVNSNFENFYITSPVLNEQTGKYEVNFELYASYDYMWADSKDPIGFNVGTNPGGFGFWHDGLFANGNIYANKKITKNGIKQVERLDASDCLEHDFNEYVTGTKPTCTSDGTQTRTCRWCNYVDTQVLTHHHAYNVSDLVVDTPATCTTPGVGHGSCATCGQVHNDVIVPVDTYNHTAYNEELGRCTDCNNSLKATEVFDKYNAGGWDNPFHYVATNLTGEFDVTVTYKHQVNNAGLNWGDFCWRGVLPAVRDASVNNGSVWMVRYDWWGWCDKRDSAENLGTFHISDTDARGLACRGEAWHMGNDQLFQSIMADSVIDVTFSRRGTTLYEDFVISHNNINYFYRARLLNVNPNTPINLGFGAEFAKAEIQKVVYNY